MEIQLIVDLVQYLLPGALLSCIVILISPALVLYSLYQIISAIWGEKISPRDGEFVM